MTRIVVGPFNRVEGDLEVSLDVSDGRVAAAYVNSPLFRGFEQLLVGRAPADALAVVPRICGICSVAQSAAAALALADATGTKPTANGRRAQWLMQATENLADHLSHFYLFFMPDFTRVAYTGMDWHGAVAERFTALKGSATNDFLPARARFLEIMGFIAGKWPHTLAFQPGGSTRAVTAGERVRLLSLLREFRGFLERVTIGDSLEAFSALASLDALFAWAEGHPGDLPGFLRVGRSLGLERIGRGYDAFLSYGAYDRLPAGYRRAGEEVQALDISRIAEDASHAWLQSDHPLPPALGRTVVDADKAEAYTWCKAPRYDGEVAEVGALARQMVAGHPLLTDIVVRHGGSVMARVLARFIEVAQVVPLMEAWIRDLQPGEPFCQSVSWPTEGQGVGLVEAARGGLGHWLSFKKGKIERYQIVAPTTWNFSPRDEAGQPGPLEKALLDIPVGPGAPPLVQHVVRSFDPCMVCTVH